VSTCVWDVLNFVIMVREIAQITTWNLCLYMVAGLIQIYTIRFKDQGEMIKTLLLNNVINVEIFQVDIVEVDTAKNLSCRNRDRSDQSRPVQNC